jgi:rhomboid protease GluP
MFAQFSMCLYEKTAREDYKLSSINGEEISDTTHWVVRKAEMSTFVSINVIDSTRKDFQTVLAYDKEATEDLKRRFGGEQLVSVYILAGGEPPDFEGVEEYYGQSVYSIFWHLNLETGEITVPRGIPKKLFNIREMVTASCREAAEVSDTTFSEITSRADALRPKEKHRYAIFSFALILINAAILALMYLDGYYEGNSAIPQRFGAIVVNNVINLGEWYRLFYAMFLHFGFTHFMANATGILIFGVHLERYLGRGIFLLTYFLSGLAGSALSLTNSLINPPDIPTVAAGASGAVYGLIGAIFAYTRITKHSIGTINWYVMVIFIGFGITMGLATDGIDNFAHFGGLLCGAVIGGIYACIQKGKTK